MAADLARLDVRQIGLDTEFAYGPPRDAPVEDWEEWCDLSQLRVILVGFTALVGGVDGGLVAVRYAVDVRDPKVARLLKRVLRLPVTFVAHHFKSEYFAVKALHLPWPRSVFCTWTAARLLTLGLFHARYVDPEPVDEFAEKKAEAQAEATAFTSTSLLALASKHGIVYPFTGNKDAMQKRYASLREAEALTDADAAYVIEAQEG
jgi:hypothetical protein